MWAKKAQRWRKKNKRAVSPIIATILLVAITVVLAAVLYVLISGLTRGPGNTTLGSALALGTAAESTSVAAAAPFAGSTIASCAVNTCYIYTFTVESAGGGITWNGVDLTVSGSAGLWTTATAGYAVLSISGAVVAYSNGAQATTWTGAGTTAISSTQSLEVVLQGSGAAPANGNLAGQAYTLNALGVGSFSGTIHANIP